MKRRLLIASLLLVLAVTASSRGAQVARPGIPVPPTAGYYVLTLVLHIQQEEVGDRSFTAVPYVLARHHEGPYDYAQADARLNQIGFEGLREGDEYYPTQLVQKAWIYFRCSGCELE